MAKATYVSDAHTIDYTPTTDLDAGSVVVVGGDLLGITTRKATAGQTTGLAITGVFDVTKDNSDITVGEKVYWDAANQRATDVAAGNKLLGVAIEAAGPTAQTVRILKTS